MEENLQLDLTTTDEEGIVVEKPVVKPTSKRNTLHKVTETVQAEPTYVNCLRNERVIVRFIKRGTKLISDPKHVLYGGMSEHVAKLLTVPKLKNGSLKNVLTNNEKDYLEYIMGLPTNALSIYNKVDNYWENYFVRLTKDDSYLDLSNPEDYIKYKVLLTNEDLVAPNLSTLESRPKASYKFVLITETDEVKADSSQMELALKAHAKFADMAEDLDALRVVLEVMEGKPTASTVKLSFVKPQVFKRLMESPKLFLSATEVKYFDTWVFIKKCVEANVITKRGDYYYRTTDSLPLALKGYDPTLENASLFLNSPAHQDIKFSLEAMLKSK